MTQTSGRFPLPPLTLGDPMPRLPVHSVEPAPEASSDALKALEARTELDLPAAPDLGS